MRECIVCGQRRENGNEGLIYDYCQTCYGTDLDLLHKRQQEREEKGPSDPAKESREAR